MLLMESFVFTSEVELLMSSGLLYPENAPSTFFWVAQNWHKTPNPDLPSRPSFYAVDLLSYGSPLLIL